MGTVLAMIAFGFAAYFLWEGRTALVAGIAGVWSWFQERPLLGIALLCFLGAAYCNGREASAQEEPISAVCWWVDNITDEPTEIIGILNFTDAGGTLELRVPISGTEEWASWKSGRLTGELGLVNRTELPWPFGFFSADPRGAILLTQNEGGLPVGFCLLANLTFVDRTGTTWATIWDLYDGAPAEDEDRREYVLALAWQIARSMQVYQEEVRNLVAQ